MKLRIAESPLPLRKAIRKINTDIIYHKGRYSTLQERLERHDSGIIITDYVGDVVNLLINKPKPYRIVYDTVFGVYGIGDAYNFIHGDIQNVLKEYGYEEKTTHTVTLRSKKVRDYVVKNHEIKSQVLLSFEPYNINDMSWEVGGFVGERASSCYITTGVILTTSPLDIEVPDLYNNIKKRNFLLDKSYESKIIHTLEHTALEYQKQELSIIDKIVSDSDFEHTDYTGCYNYLLKYNKRPDLSDILKGFVPGKTLHFPHNLDYRLHDVQGKIIDIYHKIQDIKKYGIQYMKDTFGDIWDVTED